MEKESAGRDAGRLLLFVRDETETMEASKRKRGDNLIP